jgi:3-deoxy-7-phosphoheptulonate synthase/chorismate mutase
MEIDGLNAQLLDLLEARGRLVEKIAELKKRHGIQVHDPDREGAMLAAVLARATSPFSREQIARVFQCILEVSRECAKRNER